MSEDMFEFVALQEVKGINNTSYIERKIFIRPSSVRWVSEIDVVLRRNTTEGSTYITRAGLDGSPEPVLIKILVSKFLERMGIYSVPQQV